MVSIYNERGTVLAGAYVTERIMPGAVGIDHGAKYDPIVPGEIDRGGVINTIVPRQLHLQEHRGHGRLRLPGGGGEDRPGGAAGASIPEAFARECHPAAGPCLAGVMMEGVE